MRPGRWFLASGVACLLVARMPAGRMPDAGACHMPLGTGFSPGLRLAAERVIDALLGSWRAEWLAAESFWLLLAAAGSNGTIV